MVRLLYIAIGGAVGAVFRYLVSGWTHRVFDDGFPWGTLSVNLIGSLVIGLLWGVSEMITISNNIRLLVFLGILGSFTTFSTFSLENYNMLRDGEYWFVTVNIAATVFFGLMLVFLGLFLSRFSAGLLK